MDNNNPPIETENASLVQPGVFIPELPDPMPGELLFELAGLVGGGSYSNVFQGTWIHDGESTSVCIKRLLEDRIKFDKEVQGLTVTERFRRVCPQDSILRSKHFLIRLIEGSARNRNMGKNLTSQYCPLPGLPNRQWSAAPCLAFSAKRQPRSLSFHET